MIATATSRRLKAEILPSCQYGLHSKTWVQNLKKKKIGKVGRKRFAVMRISAF